MGMQELIDEFIAQERFAIVGASDNSEKYGNEIAHDLRSRGYEVYPVNPTSSANRQYQMLP